MANSDHRYEMLRDREVAKLSWVLYEQEGLKFTAAVRAEPPCCRLARQPLPYTVNILSLRARGWVVASCGGGRSWPRFDDERQTIVPPLFALCMSGQAAAGHYHRAALLQPDLAHCAQPPEHHHRPASCHGELLLRPLARLARWHTLAICCSRSASSSPHSCHGAVATHLLAGLSRAGSPAGATRRPLSLVHHGPRRLLAVGARRQCAGTVEPEHRVLDASGVKYDLMRPNMQQ